MDSEKKNKDIQQEIKSIETAEKELVFTEFNETTAYELGTAIYRRALKNGTPVTIDIRKGEQILLHIAMEGTSANNDLWVARKSNSVQLMHKSSYRIGRELALAGDTLENRHFLDPTKYCAHGGSFPIRIKGSGVIAAVTVSGLPQKKDHDLVVAVLREFLAV